MHQKENMRSSQKPKRTQGPSILELEHANIRFAPSFVNVLFHFLPLDCGLKVVIFMCNVIGVQTVLPTPPAKNITPIEPIFCI